jgi:hypothetical protein
MVPAVDPFELDRTGEVLDGTLVVLEVPRAVNASVSSGSS